MVIHHYGLFIVLIIIIIFAFTIHKIIKMTNINDYLARNNLKIALL